MDVTDLVTLYPTVFHMADAGSWPSIQRYGLLPTRTLVEMFEDDPAVRQQLLNQVRSTSVVLSHPSLGAVTIRDQKPAKFLDVCLTPESSRQQFLDALNSRVYFWATRERLERLLNARAYRSQANVILHIDTAALVAACGDRIELAPYNTGSMHVPTAPKRDHTVFKPVADYPFQEWVERRGRTGEPVVEVTVRDGLTNISEVVRRVERVRS